MISGIESVVSLDFLVSRLSVEILETSLNLGLCMIVASFGVLHTLCYLMNGEFTLTLLESRYVCFKEGPVIWLKARVRSSGGEFCLDVTLIDLIVSGIILSSLTEFCTFFFGYSGFVRNLGELSNKGFVLETTKFVSISSSSSSREIFLRYFDLLVGLS